MDTIKVAPPAAPMPEITVSTGDGSVRRMVDEAITALAGDWRTYQRGGKLVHVVTIPDNPNGQSVGVQVGRQPGTPVILEMHPAVLLERLDDAARWLKYNAAVKSHVKCNPPESVISALVRKGEWPGVKRLVSVTTSPVLRPDGTVLQKPGYDRATGILYWPSQAYLPVPDQPTLDDARVALGELLDVVCDFPFAQPANRTAWVAGLLTMFARSAIDGCTPLFAIDATTPGTGKSRLIDAAVRIAHRTDAARTSMPEEDEEMRKRITSLVLEGDPAVCLDNIKKKIAFPSLDAVLTSTVWKDRELGKNGTVQAPHTTVWWATGNNLTLGGDLARRTLHVRLQSKVERPEDRTGFKHDPLLAWVSAERPRLVCAALTLLRAFMLAGAPYSGPVWGSFEEWSRIVPAAIVWAGGDDPLAARSLSSDIGDEDTAVLTVLLEGLCRLLGNSGRLTARDILVALYPTREHGEHSPPDGYDDVRDVITSATRGQQGKMPEVAKFGYLLRSYRGRIHKGLCLEGGLNRAGTTVWEIIAT